MNHMRYIAIFFVSTHLYAAIPPFDLFERIEKEKGEECVVDENAVQAQPPINDSLTEAADNSCCLDEQPVSLSPRWSLWSPSPRPQSTPVLSE